MALTLSFTVNLNHSFHQKLSQVIFP
jgi:hypothetical protein